MKKIILPIIISNFIFANTNCLIDFNVFKNLSNEELLKIAKNCKPTTINKNRYYIANTKTITIKTTLNPNKKTIKKSITHNTIYNSNSKNPAKIIININNNKIVKISKPNKPKIKKIPNLAKMNLKNLLIYAIKHNLTTKTIGMLIIQKSRYYPNLDIEYIKDVFSNPYSKKDLEALLKAINS